MKYSQMNKTLLYIYLHSIVVLAHNKIIVYNHDDSINIVSQATPFAERKGLVTLQPLSCPHGRNLTWPIRSVLFLDRVRCHEVVLCHVFNMTCSIIAFLGNSLVVAAWPDPSSLIRRVWLARLSINISVYVLTRVNRPRTCSCTCTQ